MGAIEAGREKNSVGKVDKPRNQATIEVIAIEK